MRLPRGKTPDPTEADEPIMIVQSIMLPFRDNRINIYFSNFFYHDCGLPLLEKRYCQIAIAGMVG
jgi:hypothetical protein